ncbi:hypothetical protein [Robertkochia solimangrovi]|uniref:hypothetical protein n=1 Tax=Robertkochia solimangrovi TaxID=2213046 RepID=UPI00117F1B45|nr:hypothetical protein [Robertkochia solimangrovi]TRZ45747.1 hypothetical protein DMZ48_00245 [Robertkochia solimangrovi]
MSYSAKSNHSLAARIILESKAELAKGNIRIAEMIYYVIGAVNFVIALGLYLYARSLSVDDSFLLMTRNIVIKAAFVPILLGNLYLLLGSLFQKHTGPVMFTGIFVMVMKILFQIVSSGFYNAIGFEFILDVMCCIALICAAVFYIRSKHIIEEVEKKIL